MKIAVFTDTYLPQINGVVTSTVTFVREFEKMGHEVLIIAPQLKGAKESTSKVWRLPAFPFPFQPEYNIVAPISKELVTFKSLKIDLIHAQTPFSMGLLALYFGKRFKIPVVHTYHTFFVEYAHYVPVLPQRLVKELAKFKWFCNSCEYLVVPTKRMAEKLPEYGIETPMQVIPTGIDLAEIRKSTAKEVKEFRAVYDIAPNKKVLIFVGRIGKEKNVFFLLDSFVKILKKVPNTVLFIAGDGPEREHLEKKARELGVFENIIFAGYVDHQKIFVAFKMADVFVFPSKTETQGLVLLEGLAAGTPGVCIDAMGVADILKGSKGGFLTADDLTVYSEKVIELLNNKNVYEQKKTEALDVAQKFCAEGLAQKMIKVYQKAILIKKGDKKR